MADIVLPSRMCVMLIEVKTATVPGNKKKKKKSVINCLSQTVLWIAEDVTQ